MDIMMERPRELGSQVTVCRSDGTEVPVRLRLLGYDSCEFETDQSFAAGEQVGIHLYRMGLIRARVTSRHAKVVEAKFDMDCPV